MRFVIFIPLMILSAIYISGCAPRTLNSGAENVHLYDYLAPKSCKFLGNIMNPSVHGDLDLSSSVEDLQKDDINYLKNEGARLGANVVVLVSHESYETTKKRLGRHTTTMTYSRHSVAAKAFNCTSGLMPKRGSRSTTHVKINETPLI